MSPGPSPRVVVLTGAGISAESGVPTFRDAGGLWEGHRVEDVATPEAFERDPDTVQRFYDARRRAVASVAPNPAHLALARLEARARRRPARRHPEHRRPARARRVAAACCTCTASSASALCAACGARSPVRRRPRRAAAVPGMRRADAAPRRRLVRRDALRARPHRRGARSRATCSSRSAPRARCIPAAGFVLTAAALGARTIELNLAESEITPFFDEMRLGPASEVVPAWVDELLSLR